MGQLEESYKQRAIELLKSGYGRQIISIAASYVSVLFWGTPPSLSTEAIINHGSIFFLECGGPPLAVTAAHVYENYWSRKQNNSNLVCQIDNLPFDPENRLIDRDHGLDIATFRIEEQEITRLGKWVHKVDQSEWPPSPPQPGQGVFFAGFPSRTILDSQSVEYDIHSALLIATVVNDRNIICQFERDEWVDILGKGLPPKNNWLGGLSGAPLWTLQEKPIVKWSLGGIISEYSQDFELLYATRPDRIMPDGTLVK